MIDLTTFIGILGAGCTVLGTWLGYQNGLKKEYNADGSLQSDVGYIKAGVDDLKKEQRSLNQMHYELAERVGRVEESAKSAHHRLDGLEEKLK